MPQLASEHLVWNIRYHHANTDWYYYRMTLHWKGLPVINPGIRHKNDNDTPPDEYGLCHNDCDGLRHILDFALSSGRPVAWDCIEPDMSLAIYPGTYWPFCDYGCHDLFDSRVDQEKAMQREQERLKEAFRADGTWTFMFSIDTEHFIDSDGISGDGAMIMLGCERKDVERFRAELQKEYEEFSERIGYREPSNSGNPYDQNYREQ